MRRVPLLLWIPAALLAAGHAAAARGGAPGAGDPARGGQGQTSPRIAIVEAEAARASTPEQLQLLVREATTSSPLQPIAIRALGRLERAGLVDTLLPLLGAAQAAARAEAAWALAQSAGSDPAAVYRVREALLQRLVGGEDVSVVGAVGEALGRLPIEPSPRAGQASAPATDQIEKALVTIASRLEVSTRVDREAAGGRIVGLRLIPSREALVPMPALLGALRGLEAFARAKSRARQTLLPATVERLRALATDDPTTSATRSRAASLQADAARARRLALLCLLPVGGVDAALAARALDDPDDQVRRLAVSAPAADRASIDRGLKDPAWLVRYESLRAYGRRFQATEGCAPILEAIGAQADHVSLLAVDLLGYPCRADDKAVERLIDLALGVASLAAGPGLLATEAPSLRGSIAKAFEPRPALAWHRPAHAIEALARIAPDRARPYIARFLQAKPWQSRMYAARAAGLARDVELLRRFAGDEDDNVREAAIAGLSKAAAHDADPIYLAALAAGDFQLVRTAAAALAGSPDRAAAVRALLETLTRLTALDADPSRDPRTAVIERIGELGSKDQADALRPYLGDTDPRVAEAAARVLSAWTGAAVAAAPRARQAAPPEITDTSLQRLEKTVVRVTMAGGGQFEIRPLADLAPVSALRFVERAGRGYYNGLTFHRVLPNFLIQGGSPGANEFAGDTRYVIDEPGRVSQTRGTVGSSTRGRDTGDGQFYVNLVDTPRLDHEYSIFGEVISGMDVVDRILEGDVTASVEPVVR